MGTIWFWLVAFMLVAYVVLDGFDLGVGILHLVVARTPSERALTLGAIGPVWDGNEVWLIAAGGTLFFAFPLLYASAFSGFYLPLTVVLWMLILRGIAIEFRSQIDSRVWREFFDGIFTFASAMLAILFGAALANVIRGVPIGDDGYFFAPFWTDWRAGPNPGILDWYTTTGGVLALIALAVHGGFYLAVKSEGVIQHRARVWAQRLWPALLLLTLVGVPGTVYVRHASLHNYLAHPVAFAIPLEVATTLAAALYYSRRQRDLAAFLSSSAYLIGMMVGAAVGLYPIVLPSSNDASRSISIDSSLAGLHGLRVGLVWWMFGMSLAIGYFVLVYWQFRGKVTADSHGYH